MKLLKCFAVGVAIVFVVGCAAKVQHSFDRTASFENRKTFAWMEQAKVDLGIADMNDALIEEKIKEAVEKQLLARGLAKAATGMPDLLLNLKVAVQDGYLEGTMDDAYEKKFNSNVNRWDYQIRRYPIDVGSVIIDMIDPASQQVIWRGIAEAKVLSTGERKRVRRMNKAINKIFRGFPPR